MSGFSEEERAVVDELLQRIRANLTNDPQIVDAARQDPALPLPRSA